MHAVVGQHPSCFAQGSDRVLEVLDDVEERNHGCRASSQWQGVAETNGTEVRVPFLTDAHEHFGSVEGEAPIGTPPE